LEKFGQGVRVIAVEVDNAIVPIFVETNVPRGVQQIGTGVFIDFYSEPFLFTVAHVTDAMESGRLLVPTDEGLIELEGYIGHIDLLPEQVRDEDSVDVAYWRLSSNFARKLCAHFFPLVSNYDLVQDPAALGVVSVVGFPVSKSKRRGDSFKSELAHYRGMVAERQTYDYLELMEDQNILVHFHKKNALSPCTGKKVNVTSPRGISGGAIFSWPYGHEFSQDWRIPKLVGIVHSYKANMGLFIGTTLVPYAAAITLGKMKGYNGVT